MVVVVVDRKNTLVGWPREFQPLGPRAEGLDLRLEQTEVRLEQIVEELEPTARVGEVQALAPAETEGWAESAAVVVVVGIQTLRGPGTDFQLGFACCYFVVVVVVDVDILEFDTFSKRYLSL